MNIKNKNLAAIKSNFNNKNKQDIFKKKKIYKK